MIKLSNALFMVIATSVAAQVPGRRFDCALRALVLMIVNSLNVICNSIAYLHDDHLDHKEYGGNLAVPNSSVHYTISRQCIGSA